jgi:hypothetical protein
VIEQQLQGLLVVGHVDRLPAGAVRKLQVGAVTQQQFDVFGWKMGQPLEWEIERFWNRLLLK